MHLQEHSTFREGVVAGAIGALIVALAAASFAERLARYVWPGWVWVIPVLSMIACVYLTLPWFWL